MTEISRQLFAARFGPVHDLPHDPTIYTSGYDLAALFCLSRGARRIIEFGTARGETTLALARFNPHAEIVTVDIDVALAGCYPDTRPFLEVGEAFHGTPEAARIRQIWTRPWGAHDSSTWGRPFDFAFVDSLHTRDGVHRDTEAATMLGCRRIVWDDVLIAGVAAYLRERSNVIHVEGSRLAFADLIPAATP